MQVISTIETYVVDSLQYLQGLMPSYDLLATMREQRDRFLTRLLVELYLIHAQNLLRNGAHVQSFILVRALMPTMHVHCTYAAVLTPLDGPPAPPGVEKIRPNKSYLLGLITREHGENFQQFFHVRDKTICSMHADVRRLSKLAASIGDAR